jgi:hypothetical protein
MIALARSLWDIIQSKTGLKKDLLFIQDHTLPVGAYRIKGDEIRYNDDRGHAGSVYAVSRLSNELFQAIMTAPSTQEIYVEKGEWRDLNIEYTPPYVVCNFTNLPISGDERTWLWWHHIPNYGTGGATFNRSWFLNLCVKYPQLGQPGVTPHAKMKPNIFHPEFPSIIYQEWVERGRPDVCSLFEIDGNGYWWAHEIVAPPPNDLNPWELNRYRTATSQGLARDPVRRNPDGSWAEWGRVDGIRYPLTDKFDNALSVFERNRAGSSRYNYTKYYIPMYKAVEKYFEEQGAGHVRFNILAYHCYRELTRDSIGTDLSKFNVYYTSVAPTEWTQERMMLDRTETRRWWTTKCKLIWRPNLWFRDRFYPFLNFQKHTAYVRLMEFDGIWITGYTPAAIPLVQGINYYTMFRQLQGVRFQQSVQEYLKGKPTHFVQFYRQALAITEQFNRPWREKIHDLVDCIEKDASLKYIDFLEGRLTKQQLLNWWEEVIANNPGSATISRVDSAIGEAPPPED